MTTPKNYPYLWINSIGCLLIIIFSFGDTQAQSLLNSPLTSSELVPATKHIISKSRSSATIHNITTAITNKGLLQFRMAGEGEPISSIKCNDRDDVKHLDIVFGDRIIIDLGCRLTNIRTISENNISIVSTLDGDKQNQRSRSSSTIHNITTATIGATLRSEKRTADISPSTAINVYPNPSSDVVMVNHLTGNNRLLLINLNGQEMYRAEQVEESSFLIHVEDFPRGLYLLIVQSDTGESSTHKISVVK